MSEVLHTVSGQWQGLHFVAQSLSRVRLFETPWTATCQASLPFTTLRSLFKPSAGYYGSGISYLEHLSLVFQSLYVITFLGR